MLCKTVLVNNFRHAPTSLPPDFMAKYMHIKCPIIFCLVLQDYLKSEPVNSPISSETRILGIGSLGTLVYLPNCVHVHIFLVNNYVIYLYFLSKLEPQLLEAEKFDAISFSLNSVLPLPMASPSLKRKEVVVSCIHAM